MTAVPGRKAHPAVFNDKVLAAFQPFIEPGWRVLDPFAGIGKIHLLGANSWGVEIEPEWATQHPRTVVGDALHLPFRDGSFDATFTSITYGNRMADSHDAQERCKPCKGTGITGQTSDPDVLCEKCHGLGRRSYKRITYTHYMGRKLHPNNSGHMQWGKRYRAFHEAVWVEITRVTDHTLGLNVKDHVRNHVRQEVTDWHVETLEALGWREKYREAIPVNGMGFGQNQQDPALKDDYESVIIFGRAA